MHNDLVVVDHVVVHVCTCHCCNYCCFETSSDVDVVVVVPVGVFCCCCFYYTHNLINLAFFVPHDAETNTIVVGAVVVFVAVLRLILNYLTILFSVCRIQLLN